MTPNALNYHHLLYFWAVAKEGSLRRASEVLHVSQPSISAQLKQLEESLGAPLFTRTTRRLLLTDTQGCTVSPKFAVRQGNDFPNNVIDVRALP